MQLIPGTRWISETEPELGLGVLLKIEGKRVFVNFPGKDITRQYSMGGAPIKRVKFEVGDKIKSADGIEFTVESVTEDNGILIYLGEGQSLAEVMLADSINYNKPEEKLFLGSWDKPSLYDLRTETNKLKKRWLSSDWKGYLGPRISLLPHQYYVAKTVVESPYPRVLLADEVGLGKTIEAGLILHKLKLSGRVDKVLILVPEALIYQWFVEMLRKFETPFLVIDEKNYSESGESLFAQEGFHLLSLQLLKKESHLTEIIQNNEYDLLIVDEAHRLDWKVDQVSEEYSIAEKLAFSIPGLLLLSATPEQLGEEGHFARLRLLDPDRFSNLEKYREEKKNYKELADLSQKILGNEQLCDEEVNKLKELNIEVVPGEEKKSVRKLLDYHGTGRVFYRNTRDSIQETFKFNPKRLLQGIPLQLDQEKIGNLSAGFSTRAKWLVRQLSENPNKKFLLICSSKKQVEELEQILITNTSVKVGLFHSDIPMTAKDRQAAYFADPKGSQILLCTEIGSEGRNFAFVSDLILFDLPNHPDLLEQRIGRLDRIGQKQNINIWVPYVKNSREEKVFSWYHDGLDAFSRPIKGALKVYETYADELNEKLNNNEISKSDWDQFVSKIKKAHHKILQTLESGRDLLVEWNSFDYDHALDIVNNIKDFEDPDGLEQYMERVFHHMGVSSENLDEDTLFVKPSDNMFIPYFPELPNEGVSVTFKRWKALEREDFRFLTWDSAMVTGAIDLLISEQIGNTTVVRWLADTNELVLECIFLMTPVAPKEYELDRYLPPTLIRIAINAQGENVTKKYNYQAINEKTRELEGNEKETVSTLPKDAVKRLIKKAQIMASQKATLSKEKAMKEMKLHFLEEQQRLDSLKKAGAIISEDDFEYLQLKRAGSENYIKEAPIALDAIRLIF